MKISAEKGSHIIQENIWNIIFSISDIGNRGIKRKGLSLKGRKSITFKNRDVHQRFDDKEKKRKKEKEAKGKNQESGRNITKLQKSGDIQIQLFKILQLIREIALQYANEREHSSTKKLSQQFY